MNPIYHCSSLKGFPSGSLFVFRGVPLVLSAFLLHSECGSLNKDTFPDPWATDPPLGAMLYTIGASESRIGGFVQQILCYTKRYTLCTIHYAPYTIHYTLYTHKIGAGSCFGSSRWRGLKGSATGWLNRLLRLLHLGCAMRAPQHHQQAARHVPYCRGLNDYQSSHTIFLVQL